MVKLSYLLTKGKRGWNYDVTTFNLTEADAGGDLAAQPPKPSFSSKSKSSTVQQASVTDIGGSRLI